MSANNAQPMAVGSLAPSPEMVFIHITNAVRFACRVYQQRVTQHELEDLSHEVFVLLVEDNYRRLSTFDSRRGSLKTWIYTVTKHYVKHRLQQKNRAISLEDLIPDSLIYHSKQEQDVLIRERREAVHAMLARLPKYLQELFVLTIEGFSDAEISRLLGIKVDSVRKHRYVLTNTLKKLFEPKCAEKIC